MMMMIRHCIFLIAVLVVLPLPAIAETPIIGLLGDWTGSGTVRPQLLDDRQEMRCRISGESDEEFAVTLSGRCATAQKSMRISIEITQKQGDWAYRAVASVGNSPRTFSYIGKDVENGIWMRSREPFRQDGRSLVSVFEIGFESIDRVTISESVTEVGSGAQTETLQITLTR